MLASASSDIRYVLRRLRRRPLHFLGVAGMLALAMGGSLTVFSLVDELILHPLDVPQPGEVVTLIRPVTNRGVTERRVTVNWVQADLVRSLPGGPEVAVTTTPDDTLSKAVTVVAPSGQNDAAPVRFVSWNYFRVLRVRPIIGRDLQAADDVLSAGPVVLVSRRYWREKLDGRPDAIGRQIHVNGVPATVIGVVADEQIGTQFGGTVPDLFLPVHTAPEIGRETIPVGAAVIRLPTPDGQFIIPPVEPADLFEVVARVPAAERDRVQAEVVTLLRSDQWSLVPLQDTMLPFNARQDVERFLRLLGLAVGCVLILGCVNAGLLIVGDARERRQEIALRTALGAAPVQIFQLVGLEVGLISLVAGVGATAVAGVIRAGLTRLSLPGSIALRLIPGHPLRTTAFAAALALVTAGLISLAAIRLLRAEGVGLGARATLLSRGGRRLSWLCAFQAAVCVSVAVSALFFADVVTRSLAHDLGFEPVGLLQATVSVGQAARLGEPIIPVNAFVEDLKNSPGIDSATLGPVALINGSDDAKTRLHVDGNPVVLQQPLEIIYADNDYFRTIGQRLSRGRDFSAQDSEHAPDVTIVNEAAARLLWHGEDPIGHQLVVDAYIRTLPGAEQASKGSRIHCRFEIPDATPICSVPIRVLSFEVVGVVPTVVMGQLGEPARPLAYMAQSQHGLGGFVMGRGTAFVGVRSQRPEADVATLLGGLAKRHDLRLESVLNAVQARDAMLRPQRLARALLGFLSLVAFSIMVAGTYAAVHNAVLRDQRANAVRLALGALPGSVVVSTLGWMVAALAVGVCAGSMALVAWGRPLLQPFGLGVPAVDLKTLILSACGVLVAGAVAAYIPSRRIYRLDPIELLRE